MNYTPDQINKAVYDAMQDFKWPETQSPLQECVNAVLVSLSLSILQLLQQFLALIKPLLELKVSLLRLRLAKLNLTRKWGIQPVLDTIDTTMGKVDAGVGQVTQYLEYLKPCKQLYRPFNSVKKYVDDELATLRELRYQIGQIASIEININLSLGFLEELLDDINAIIPAIETEIHKRTGI
jgi:hypothetical protein